MARRYFNWKLIIVVLMGFFVLGSTAFILRHWRRSRRAEQGLVLGNKAYDEHRWEEAASQLGRYISVMQGDVQALLKYADAQTKIRPVKQGNINQAIAAYRNILRLDQSNLEAAKRLSEIYISMGMPGEAELIVSRMLQTTESPDMRRILAIALAGQRKFSKAVKELKGTIEKNPGYVPAYEILGRLAEQRPEDFPEDPETWFDKAVKANPSLAEAHIARGAYFLRMTLKDKALADLGQAEQMDLSDPAVRLRLAEEFINAGALDSAKKQLEIVQEAQRANQSLWRLWVKFAIKSDSNDIMFKVADTGLKELASQPWDFMPDAVELFIRCGQFERAGECLDMMRQKDVAPPATAYLEGLLAEKQGNLRKAVEYWRKAIQLGARSTRVRLLLADSLWRLDDKQASINQLRTLVSEHPGLFRGRMALARMLVRTGQWDEAAEQVRVAKQIDPRNIEVVLLDVKVRLQLLANSGTDKNSVLYRDIKTTLDGLDKTTSGDLEVKLMQIQLAYLQNNFSEAENLMADLKEKYPDKLKVVLARADLLVAQNKTDEAIALLRETNDKFPRSTAVLKYLVTLMSAKNQLQDCTTLLKQALMSVEQPLAKRELGLLLSSVYDRTNENDKRYLLLKSLADELPNDIPIWREMLTCKKVSEDVGLSQQIIDRIKSIEGDDGWQWRYEQAKLWFELGDFKTRYPAIVAILQENLLTNPDDQTSRMLLAATYEKGNNQRLAISTYDEALRRSPSDIRIIVPTVVALYRGGEYARAQDVLQRATREKLSHPKLMRLEIQDALRRGDLDSANDVLEKMLVKDPNDSSLLLSLVFLKIQQNKFTEAEKLLQELRVEEPNSLLVAEAKVELDIRMGRSDDALQVCDEMMDKLNIASACLLRGRVHATLGLTEEAREDFERAVTMEPNNPNVWSVRSDFHRSLGESYEAIADIRRALSIVPDDIQIQKNAVSLYLASDNSGLRREGKAILEKALASNPGDVELRFWKARLLISKETAPGIEQASEILQSITEKRPEVTEAWLLLAQIALQEAEPAEAIDLALRGLVHNPNDRNLLLLKARAEAARSPELALPTMRALWELDPNDTDIVVLLAEAYMAAGKYDDAINLLRNQPVSPDGSQQRKIDLALASSLYKNGNKIDSERIFEDLYESEPNDSRPLLVQVRLFRDDKLWSQLREKALAWCEKYPGDIETVVFIVNELAGVKEYEGKKITEELLRCVLKQDENSVVAMMRLGVLLQTSGRSTEAQTLYERVLRLQPDNLVAVNNLAWILCEEQNRPQEALELAQRGLAKEPDYVDLIDTRGMAYYRLGRYNEALQDFNRCIRLYPTRSPAAISSYFHLGRCLADLGQKKQSIEQLNKALELNRELGALGGEDVSEAHQLLEKLSSGGN